MSDDDIDDALAGPRIITLDLERLPGRVELDIWEPRDAARWRWLHPDRWSELPSTVLACWKVYGKRGVHAVAAWDAPDDPHHLAREMWAVLDSADACITYNGDRADLRWLRTLFVLAGLPRPRPFKSIDLYRINKRELGLESGSLQHLLERLGLGGKDGHYDARIARAAMSGDEAAQRRLVRYCKRDVTATEEAFTRLLPWAGRGLNLGAYYPDALDVRRCPTCGAADTLKAAGWYTAAVQTYGLLRCEACGSLARNAHVKTRTNVRGVQ